METETSKSWRDDYASKNEDPDFNDKFTSPCNTALPIGDINRWKSQMVDCMTVANNNRREYLNKYYSNEEFIAYSYEDLVSGTESNLMALRCFYSAGYKFFRPLVMWYLERGMAQQYINACSTIYYCDRNHPDFWLTTMRAAEIANEHPQMFVIALYQYFTWTTFDGLDMVPIIMPTHAILAPFCKFLRDNIKQSPSEPWWSTKNIKYDFIVSHDFLIGEGPVPEIGDDSDMTYEEIFEALSEIAANRFPKLLGNHIKSNYPHLCGMLEIR